MATFVELDANHVIINIIKVRDEDCGGGNFPESEPIGIQFLNDLFGPGRIWKQASVNSNFRNNRPNKGGSYDETLDAFVPKKPYPSWVINLDSHTNSYVWVPPVPMPQDGIPPNNTKFYRWDEPTLSWVEIPPHTH